MDSYLMQSRLYMPVVTGTPAVRPASPQKEQAPQSQESFKKILDEQVAKTSNLSFSKHARQCDHKYQWNRNCLTGPDGGQRGL